MLLSNSPFSEYNAKNSAELWRKINKKIMEISVAINSQKSNQVMSTTILNKIIYKMFPDENYDKILAVVPTCTGCATCEKVCSAKNITMKDGNPDFLHKCEHCLAYLHHCPSIVIDWNGKTQCKDRYRNSKISLDELIAFNS